MPSEAEGLPQYYDRYNPQPITVGGMQKILLFMLDRNQLPMILDSLEASHHKSF